MDKQKPLPKSYYEQLEVIQSIDLALVELNLYMDTHPNDLNALKQFNSLTKQSLELKQKFEAQFGPLMHFGRSYSEYPWKWKEAPWPWQV
ncbi:spore coat protein CotJB [Terrilactibacillus sp. BCM23-1]|uniref:Spore coat protein CotJB n=1 Tax=Terrilactibacillus tamarindi TaxID=2599694 RepID=A0A6N8CMH1_9BACI|nr:spore coat protein CotJB [Terrilactibacillus tamarindi]MTT31249.1 spore coat protein CotJB [Terrilactibacillus tamarindi]